MYLCVAEFLSLAWALESPREGDVKASSPVPTHSTDQLNLRAGPERSLKMVVRVDLVIKGASYPQGHHQLIHITRYRQLAGIAGIDEVRCSLVCKAHVQILDLLLRSSMPTIKSQIYIVDPSLPLPSFMVAW